MKSFSQHITEGVNDPAIFTAVFMAGGPGSGKSFMAQVTGLQALGLRPINSDDVFERFLKNMGLEPTPEVIFSKRGQEIIRPAAKALTKKKQEAALIGRLGFIIDGTGKNYDKIKIQKDELERLGYSTMMLFINTDLDTAQARNKQRTRELRTDVVKTMWGEVQNNIGKFQSLFGSDFLVLDNSEGANLRAVSTRGYREIVKFIRRNPPEKNRIAKRWLSQQKKARGIKEATSVNKGRVPVYMKHPKKKGTYAVIG